VKEDWIEGGQDKINEGSTYRKEANRDRKTGTKRT
jgi:hypothetical protein